MTQVATVTELRSYPVRSMDGPTLTSAEVTVDGLAGDRAWLVVDADGAVVSSRQTPELGAVQVTSMPAERDGPDDQHGPVLDLPGAARSVVGRAADDALSAYLGTPVRLQTAPGRRPGVAAVHLVSRQAVAASIGTTSEDPACDLESPRANLTLDLGEDPPADLERAWVGRDLVVGAVVLHVDRVPKHCLGVYVEVVTPGRINLGDPVHLRD